jgi:glycosyltransferase involved in cell wall biosynthesis
MTRIWPSEAAPSAGIFVANRFRNVPDVTVVIERPEGRPWPMHLARFIWRGWRAGRTARVEGVEGHVLYPAGFASLLVAWSLRVPVMVYAHGTDIRLYPQRSRTYRAFVRLVVRHADMVVTNSEEAAARIRVIGREPRIIPPGYDDRLFRPTPRPQGRRRILYLGGANPLKGYAVARSLADTLVGPGLREVPPAEVAELMSGHDVVLIPSEAEAFGLVAAEAIGSGRWVVARAVGGLMNVVVDGLNGTLVRDDDFEAGIARVPDDWDPGALARSVERFRLSAWQEQMAAAWGELLSDPSGHKARAT